MSGVAFDAAIAALAPRRVYGEAPKALAELTDDSRQAGPGVGFVAVRGSAADGHRFIPQALAQGSPVVICEALPPGVEVLAGACVIELDDTRQRLPELARAVYGDPTLGMTVFGVTGTNGKTTTTHLIESIGQRLGLKVGVIGTIAHRYPGFEVTASNTTPGLLLLTRLLRQMRDAGVDWVALEVSSHGLVQGRLATTHFDAAIWTHLGRDHLDFHETMEAYLNAKLQLFDERLPASIAAGKSPVALVNAEDAAAREAFAEPARLATLGERLRWYSATGEGFASAHDLTETPEGVRGRLRLGAWEGPFTLPLIGRFNLLNALGAASAIVAAGASEPAVVADALSRISSVPGRMEHLGGGGRPHVLIDYAHTPDALTAALSAARGHTLGRLWVVFGAGGDRDPLKRPAMGLAAARGADRVVITNDNPRSEPPQAIADAIFEGIPEARRDMVRVQLDRRAAILETVGEASPDDTVVVAGKGHEDYQIIGQERLSMDDRTLAQDALARWREAPHK